MKFVLFIALIVGLLVLVDVVRATDTNSKDNEGATLTKGLLILVAIVMAALFMSKAMFICIILAVIAKICVTPFYKKKI